MEERDMEESENTVQPEIKLPSVCPMDCPDRCSLEIGLSGGKVVSIGGSSLHAVTAGIICTKVRRFARRLYGPDRILYPMHRTGPKGSGEFTRITWQAAVEEMAERLKRICAADGPEAILPFAYGGSNGLLTHEFVDAWFFRRLGASRCLRTLCAASTTLALSAVYGLMPGTAMEDFPDARFILLWGANPQNSNIHLVPYLKEARRRGSKIGLVDPRRMLGPDLVDIHLQPRPGTDGALALGMIHYMDIKGLADRDFLARHSTGWQQLLQYAEGFPLDKAARIAGVEKDQIVRLVHTYAESEPALLRCGWGLERNRNGLSAVASVLALPAVAGKFGKRGGGFTLSSSKAYGVDQDQLAGMPEPATRVINQVHLGRALLEEAAPPIKALFVYNCNPAATVPDHNRVLAGLRREDLFTVVHDQVMTDTAVFADLVLPATTFLEHRELSKSYGTYALQLAEPVVPAAGEARSNAALFQMLGRAMGWNDGPFAEDEEALLRRALDSVHGRFEGSLSPERMLRDRIIYFDFPGRQPVQFDSVFPGTADGKIHLYSDDLGNEPYAFRDETPDPAFPLALISPASARSISSTMAEYNLLDAGLELSPVDAAARGLEEGDTVRVFNLLGEVHCRLKVDARIKEGVASLAKGIWRRATMNGSIGNALVPDIVTPVSGGACYNDARVQVEKLQAGS
jgi:anaerobic selenocysteine-containing dehydrogenase